MKQGWEIKKLGEVCEIINGFTFKSQLFREEGEDILRISNIQNGYVDLTDIAHFSKDDYPKTNFEKYAVLPNDIVVALSGATTGKFGINKTGKKLYLNQRVAICRESSSKLNHLFLLYYLQTRSKSFLESAEGVAQPNLSTEQMKQYDIPVPPREEQERIVAELDCLSGVIERKREQLRELDALAQSIFYQMFGDPITNEKGWEVKKLKDITTKIGSGATPKGGNESYKQDGISLIRSLNVHNNLFVYKDLAYIDDEQANALRNVMVEDGDVLLNITGASVARCCVVPNDVLPARVNQHVAIIRPMELVSNIYICYQFTSNAYQQELLSIGKSNGATREALTKGQLEKLDIIVPPLTLQQEFADKIEAIEKQKQLIKDSIAETEELFNSRMDYYFN